MNRYILIPLFLTGCFVSKGQNELNVNELLTAAILEGSSRNIVARKEMMNTISRSIELDLLKMGYPINVARSRSIDSTIQITSSYISFNELYVKAISKNRDSKEISRKEFVKSLAEKQGLGRYFPLLDSIFEVGLSEIQGFRKEIQK